MGNAARNFPPGTDSRRARCDSKRGGRPRVVEDVAAIKKRKYVKSGDLPCGHRPQAIRYRGVVSTQLHAGRVEREVALGRRVCLGREGRRVEEGPNRHVGPRGRVQFPLGTPGSCQANLLGDPGRCGVQPRGHRLLRRIVPPPRYKATNVAWKASSASVSFRSSPRHTPNEPAVATDDRRERGVIPLTNEPAKQVRIVLRVRSGSPGKTPRQASNQLHDRRPHTQCVPAEVQVMHQNQEFSNRVP